jgi:LytS/YehU family sensor histidine kinase
MYLFGKQKRCYLLIEASVIFFLTFGTSLISDLEYSSYEEHDISRFIDSFGYRLTTETPELLLCCLFYFGFLKRFIFERKVIMTLIAIIGFIVVQRLSTKFVINYLVAHSPIVSSELRADALREFHRPQIYFTVNYVLARSIAPLVGLAFLIRSLWQSEQVKKLREQQLLSELNYLKGQLHPHFFFNTLNNIYGLALRGSDQTAVVVARLSEMMRYILYDAGKAQVLLRDEALFLKNYVDVERIRQRNDVQLNFDEQGIQADTSIAPLLLLPFVENAFKHGIQDELATGSVTIILCETETEISLEVSNSKPSNYSPSKSTGIGLTNVRKRLELLYPERYALDIDDQPSHFRILLSIFKP